MKWSNKYYFRNGSVASFETKRSESSPLPMSGYIEPEDAIMEDTFQEVAKPKRVLQVVIDDDHPFDLDPYIGAYSGIHNAPFYRCQAHVRQLLR